MNRTVKQLVAGAAVAAAFSIGAIGMGAGTAAAIPCPITPGKPGPVQPSHQLCADQQVLPPGTGVNPADVGTVNQVFPNLGPFLPPTK
jgi:hypothetical protein